MELLNILLGNGIATNEKLITIGTGTKVGMIAKKEENMPIPSVMK